MTATLTARTTAALALVIAITPALEIETEEPARCDHCGIEAPDGDADTARDEHDWEMTEYGDLLCEDCAHYDGPTGPYDSAYYG